MVKVFQKENYLPSMKLRDGGKFWFNINLQPLSRITVENLIDVGTCEGRMIITLSKIFQPKNVFGFEPSLKNCKKAQINCPTASILNAAVSNIDGDAELRIYDSKVEHSLYQSKSRQPSRIEKVKCVRVDTWMKDNSISNIDFVKIDTQGNDLNVLKGMGSQITKAKIIMTELLFNHDDYKYAAKGHEIMAYLWDHGFCLYNMPHLFHFKDGRLSWGDGIFVRKDLM